MKTDDDIADRVTAAILEIAASTIEEIPDGGDLGPVFIGMASAYSALALNTGGEEFAKEILRLAADRLDDPRLLQIITEYNRQRGQPSQ